MPEEAKWYVVHTYSGYENKVASNLEKTVENRNLHDLIPEIKVPTETVTEIKDNKKREVERKIFPGMQFQPMRPAHTRAASLAEFFILLLSIFPGFPHMSIAMRQ